MSFSSQVQRHVNVYKNRISATRRFAVLSLLRAIVLDTPVLSGRLRGNWQVTEVSPARSEIEGVRSLAVVISDARQTLEDSPVENTIYLTNNLEYSVPIEYLGHSSVKAPRGMVRINIVRWDAIVSRAVRRARGSSGTTSSPLGFG